MKHRWMYELRQAMKHVVQFILALSENKATRLNEQNTIYNEKIKQNNRAYEIMIQRNGYWIVLLV